MRTRIGTFTSAVGLLVVLCQVAVCQESRVPPRYVDEWYDQRFLPVLVAGAILGLLTAILWLPRLLPEPHSNDIKRARIHALLALGASLVIISLTLLIDIDALSQFGRQTYEFKVLASDVFLTRQTIKMLAGSALTFAVVLIVWTRFLSDRFYRYMFIP